MPDVWKTPWAGTTGNEIYASLSCDERFVLFLRCMPKTFPSIAGSDRSQAEMGIFSGFIFEILAGWVLLVCSELCVCFHEILTEVSNFDIRLSTNATLAGAFSCNGISRPKTGYRPMHALLPCFAVRHRSIGRN